MIHATNEELTDLETRLKSTSFALNSSGYSNYLYFYITTPQSEEIDFSKINFATLKTDESLIAKFPYSYRTYLN